MATLTETAYYTRQALKYGSVAIVLIVIFRIGYGAFTKWWIDTHPPPPPEAEVAFRELPVLPFPEQEKPSLTFSLETVTGTTGDFDDMGNVFLMPVKSASLLGYDRAKEIAQRLEFFFEPKMTSETEYEWVKDEPFPSTLRIDTLSDHFSLKTNWQTRPELLSQTQAPSEAESVSLVRSWLSSIGKLPLDLTSGESKVTYLKVSGIEIVPALAQSDAQLVRVDLYRAPVNELITWSNTPDEGIAHATFIPGRIRGEKGKLTVIEAGFKYFPVEYTQSSTYPLISSQTAWQMLLDGHGYYSRSKDAISSVAIRRISLGYYDPPAAGYYLQPIFVFEGDPNFTAYIPAVSDEWFIKEEE